MDPFIECKSLKNELVRFQDAIGTTPTGKFDFPTEQAIDLVLSKASLNLKVSSANPTELFQVKAS
jgi:hypothetical protein